jgi:hypothetical protein
VLEIVHTTPAKSVPKIIKTNYKKALNKNPCYVKFYNKNCIRPTRTYNEEIISPSYILESRLIKTHKRICETMDTSIPAHPQLEVKNGIEKLANFRNSP